MRKFVILMAIATAVVACKKSETPVKTETSTAGHGYDSPGTRGQTQTATTTVTENLQTMPAYAAKNLDGSDFKLESHRDKVVLLNVWATWCGPCRFEIPELQGLHDKYAARGFEVLGSSVDEGDPQVVRDFAVEHKMTYPLVHDPEGKIAGLLDASVLPTTVLIDKQGRIVWKKIGAIMPNDAELVKAIEKSL